MTNIILFDGEYHKRLLPLTYTKPVGLLRCGIFTFEDRWKRLFPQATVSHLTASYLQVKYKAQTTEDNWYISSNLLPESTFLEELSALEVNKGLIQNGELVAYRTGDVLDQKALDTIGVKECKEVTGVGRITFPWDIFGKNEQFLRYDFDWVVQHENNFRKDHEAMNTLIGDDIFIAEGAKLTATILNSQTGPIYVGPGAEVMEGTVVRGALALCNNSTLKLSAKIYGATTVGPHSKVGGEVGNVVIQGYSNKGHDGYLGNAVIGEWCNLGADTNCSNLKNNYGEVKAWSYEEDQIVSTGLQFCGLIMGDHSKSGINTMFNTGTVVGVAANVFGAGFPPKFIPSYSWGGFEDAVTFKLEKAYEVAERVMKRRGIELTDADKQILHSIFDKTATYRSN